MGGLTSLSTLPTSSSMAIRSSPLLTPASLQISLTKSSCHENIKVELGLVTVMLPALVREADVGGTRGGRLEALWTSPFVVNSIKQLVASVLTATSSINA